MAMKTIVAAASALALLSSADRAASEGVALFGEAFLGLGYNVDSDGGLLVDDDGRTPDAVRAVSQVRFGVEMMGESDGGLVFGGLILADEAEGGEGGRIGQFEGSVFVSGEWGSLTYGDADAADERWVGDVPGDFSLTGLADITETRFVSNGGSFGEDDGAAFAENPFARPTLRYDFDGDRFGLSLSTNRDLTDVAVGVGLSSDLAGGSWTLGLGLYDFAAFTALDDGPGFPGERVPAGSQWSLGLAGEYERLSVGTTYTRAEFDGAGSDREHADNLLLGMSITLDALSVGAFYGRVLDSGDGPRFGPLEGDDGYGLTAGYELGEGATLSGGIARPYAFGVSGTDGDRSTIADLGIVLEF